MRKIESLQIKRIEKISSFAGSNWVAVALINGSLFKLIKQGGLGFWAFSERQKFERASLKQLDEVMDFEIERA